MNQDDNKGWTPVRRGPIFCSPRCGAKCTHEAYLKTKKAAEALAKRLGAGWSANVFENMGWHFQVEKGVCAINTSKDGRKTVYMVFFNSAQQFVVTAKTPEQALSTMRAYAKAHMKKITHDLKEMPL